MEQNLPWRPFRHYGRRAGVVLLCTIASSSLWAGSEAAAGDGSDIGNARLLPDVYPQTPYSPPLQQEKTGLREPYDPFFDIDWSLALRGSYRNTSRGERFDVLLVPSVSMEHIGSRSQVNFSGSAEVTRPMDGEIDVTGLRLGLETAYALDSVTTATANADFELTQDLPGTPGLASDIAIGPQTIVGSLDLGITRQFGRFNVGITGAVQRDVYGTTTLNDGSLVDNDEKDLWTLDAGLRVGFQATPIFEVFGQAGLGREIFDRPSSVLLLKPDATNGTIKGGIVGRWNEVLEAEASIGFGLRRFDAESLGEVTSRLYDARVTFTPDSTWRFAAALATEMAPPGPDTAGTTRVEYEATGEIGYTVNSWLALRALADWRMSQIDGGSDTESGYSYGVGADYKLNAHTDLSADYGFDHSETLADGEEDSHRVTVGVRVAR
jgi:hypothetical protein